MKTCIEKFPSNTFLLKCCSKWGLKNPLFIRKMENIVFECEHSSGTVYLRLTSPLRRNLLEIEAEVQWIEQLRKQNLNVPTIIESKNGKKICSFKDEEQSYEGVVFSVMKGDHPSPKEMQDPQLLHHLGALIATMHRSNEHFASVQREHWWNERGMRHAQTALATSKHSKLRQRFENMVLWMGQIEQNSINYGLVHADLGALNLFVQKNGSIGVIDFDDSCYHWYAFDLAIVIFSMINKAECGTPSSEEAQWLNSLLKGYRTIRSIDEKEVNRIPKFIEFAFLRLFFWIEDHLTLQTFHENAIEKVLKLKKMASDRILSP